MLGDTYRCLPRDTQGPKRLVILSSCRLVVLSVSWYWISFVLVDLLCANLEMVDEVCTLYGTVVQYIGIGE